MNPNPSQMGTATAQSYKAIWRGPKGDTPITVIGDLGVGADGRRYLKVKEEKGGIPADEIFRPDKLRLDAALDYISKGWTPVPIPLKQKKPIFKDWQKYHAQNGRVQQDFNGVGNIGLLLGDPSKGLTDIDLDWPEARWLAPKFLPETEMKHGRAGAPLSHYWFLCGELKTEKFSDPNKSDSDDRAMIVEMRSRAAKGAGLQTVVPPSIHPSGETYEWRGALTPAETNPATITTAVRRLAACALIARYWPNGSRHEAALALAGALLRNGWTLAEADNFILSAARVANDDELDDRAKAIVSTDEKLKAGESVTGIPKLVDIFGKKTVDKLVKWLELRPVTREQPITPTEQTPIEESEAHTNDEPAVVVAHRHVLDSILKKVVKLDFSTLFKSIDAIKQKHYLIASIEGLLKLVKAHNYQLARKNDFVFAFNGEYWAEIDREMLKDFLMAVAQKQGVPPYEAKHFEFRDKLYKQFIALAGFRTPEPSDDKVLINLLNGTFEISAENQKLRKFRAADFLTHQLKFKYDKGATAPQFQAYLDRVLPAQELQDIVAEYFGYVFTRNLKLEKALLLYGTGANGKSVLFDIMNALLGRENTGNYSLSDLMEEHNRAQIAHKLLNYGSEINASITKDIFKILVSGEAIMARLKYGNSFLMERYAKLCFNCNELPKDVEQSDAYFRRFVIIPFRVTLPESEWVVDLAQQIIKEELAGVFNWVLAGLKRLLKQKKFTESQIVKDMIAEYRRESDSVACFLRDENWGLDPQEPEHTTTLKKLHLSYQSYCREAGHSRPLGRNNFRKRLIANKIVEATKAGCAQEFYINHLGE